MRIATLAVAIAVCCLVTQDVHAVDLSSYKNTCTELGFKTGTPAHGNCVLELDRRARNLSSVPSSTSSVSGNGDGTPDDRSCQSYGFRASTEGYSDCRQKLASARLVNEQRQREFEWQVKQHQEQVAALEREAERQRQLKKAECHFASSRAAAQPGFSNMMAAVNFLACEGGASAPAVQAPPPPQRPSVVHCQRNGNFVTCF